VRSTAIIIVLNGKIDLLIIRSHTDESADRKYTLSDILGEDADGMRRHLDMDVDGYFGMSGEVS
jgi:hypothetical protein